jgi:PLD-like domain
MKMLSASKVTLAFDEIIERASRTLVIVTPYFDPWTHLEATLIQKLDRSIVLDMLLRGGDDRAKSETAALRFAQRGARVQYLDRLHAKIYLSEQQALLTSMNLIKPSRDSWEVGTLFDATEDAMEYQQIVQMKNDLFEKITLTGNSGRHAPAGQASAQPALSGPRKAVAQRKAAGYCIRCSIRIAAEPDTPLCRDCYAAWASWKNADWEEKFCHLCGVPWSSSVAKPLCRSCWETGA